MGAAAPLLAQSSGDTIPTAIIGIGGRGTGLLDGILKQPNAKVVMVCDNKPDRLDKAATTAAKSNPKATADWQRVIDNKDVQAVYIATPPHLHAEMAIAALKAGKHVYCEKPIGLTPSSIRDLMAAAKASGKVFQAGQQLRSMVQLNDAIRKIQDGVIGDILFVKAQRHASADLKYDGSSGDWYFDLKKSGGYLVEQSVHNLDLCNWVIGNHPTRAAGFGGINLHKNEPAGRDIYDHQNLIYDYPNGVTLSFTQLVYHPRNMPAGNQYVNVYGSKGSVELMGSMNFYSSDGTQQTLLSPKVEENPDAHTVAFFSAIQKGTPNPADINVGATGALTAILGNEVCRQGKVLQWSDLGVKV